LVAAQTLELNGVELPNPTEETASKIQSMLGMSIDIPIKNPIDLLAQGWAQPKIFADAFKTILNEEYYDAIMIVFAPNYQDDIGGGIPIDKIVDASKDVAKPVVSILSSPDSNKPPGYEVLEAAGIPFFSSPQRAATALGNLMKL
jgi:acyl-CoA synthetase (NDP forming)